MQLYNDKKRRNLFLSLLVSNMNFHLINKDFNAKHFSALLNKIITHKCDLINRNVITVRLKSL